MEEITEEKENKTIIFVETKKRCDDLTRRMRRDGSVTRRTQTSLY
jgi:superfamily II DNA/RNA helicase